MALTSFGGQQDEIKYGKSSLANRWTRQQQENVKFSNGASDSSSPNQCHQQAKRSQAVHIMLSALTMNQSSSSRTVRNALSLMFHWVLPHLLSLLVSSSWIMRGHLTLEKSGLQKRHLLLLRWKSLLVGRGSAPASANLTSLHKGIYQLARSGDRAINRHSNFVEMDLQSFCFVVRGRNCGPELITAAVLAAEPGNRSKLRVQ